MTHYTLIGLLFLLDVRQGSNIQQNTVAIAGWLYPGATVKHYAYKTQTQFRETIAHSDRYVDRLSLNASWKSVEKPKSLPSEEIKNTENDREQNRRDWLELQEQYPTATKTQLRKLSPALYTRLYRYDRVWLNNNSPQLQKPSVPINNQVDWNARDREILAKAKDAVEQLLKENKPVRITVSRIGSSIGLKAILEKHFDRLPQTQAYLKLVTQTVEDFQIRRIEWAVEQLDRQGEESED